MKRDHLKNVLVGGLLGSLLLVGCGKDKNADEYHDKKESEKQALFLQVSGSYRGTIAADHVGGTSMGLIQIDLWSQSIVGSTSDNTSTNTQAIMQGRITITNSSQSQAMIQTGSYFSVDYSTNGRFNGNISIPIPASGTSAAQNVQMVISGYMRGDSFNGQITTQSRAGITGFFTTVKNAQMDTASTTSVDKTAIQTFAGPLDDQKSITAKMTIRKMANTIEENFLNNFALQTSVSIQLKFINESGDAIDGVVFNGAQFDQQSGAMHAVTNYSGNVNALVSLDCLLNKSTPNPTWQCIYMSNFNGISYTFNAIGVKK